MKKIAAVTFIFFMTISFVLPAQSWSDEKISCADLKKISISLDEVSSIFNKNSGRITEGDEVDQALGEIIDGLQLVADVENDKDFDKQLNLLTVGYNKFDSDKFSSGLKAIIHIFDKLYRRDC